VNGSVSNLLYTRSDLTTDPLGVPGVIPAIDTTVTLPTTTSFRIDINGYTQAELDNIRYFAFDVSTDSTFSNFVTLKYFAPTTAEKAKVMHNIRMLGRFCIFNVATPGTRYWVKVWSHNNAGDSPVKIVSITTK
jgi:hypothetical protein